MSDKKPKAVMYCRVGNKDQLCETHPIVKEEQTMDEHVNCNGAPVGMSMYEIYSMFDEYDEISMTAMELVLTEGSDALMRQLNFDDIGFVKTFPAVYKRALELGILVEEELK